MMGFRKGKSGGLRYVVLCHQKPWALRPMFHGWNDWNADLKWFLRTLDALNFEPMGKLDMQMSWGWFLLFYRILCCFLPCQIFFIVQVVLFFMADRFTLWGRWVDEIPCGGTLPDWDEKSSGRSPKKQTTKTIRQSPDSGKMANLFCTFGGYIFNRKNKPFKLLFHGPLAKWGQNLMRRIKLLKFKRKASPGLFWSIENGWIFLSPYRDPGMS